MSLTSGRMPTNFKHAIVTPLLKKPGAERIYKNYRPVSNLPFLSKINEKAVSQQLTKHVTANNLSEDFQSAYKSLHSTETALLKVVNDLLIEADEQKVILVAFLDLSAAFDTVDHTILLDRLQTLFGISETALAWCRSYLTGRTQAVTIDGLMSQAKELDYSVPQGSGLGPDFYCKYTVPLGIIIRMFYILFHMYADDSQLYKSLRAHLTEEQVQSVESLQSCIEEISCWMNNNKLKLNEDKTEFLIVGTPKQRSKMIVDSINVGGVDIKASDCVRNLGVLLDSGLTMEHQIRAISKSCY